MIARNKDATLVDYIDVPNGSYERFMTVSLNL